MLLSISLLISGAGFECGAPPEVRKFHNPVMKRSSGRRPRSRGKLSPNWSPAARAPSHSGIPASRCCASESAIRGPHFGRRSCRVWRPDPARRWRAASGEVLPQCAGASRHSEFRFHDRHTLASWYMMNGGDLYELAKSLEPPGFGKFLAAAKSFRMWWPGTDLNRRRRPFQGRALPTELPGHQRTHQSTKSFKPDAALPTPSASPAARPRAANCRAHPSSQSPRNHARAASTSPRECRTPSGAHPALP